MLSTSLQLGPIPVDVTVIFAGKEVPGIRV